MSRLDDNEIQGRLDRISQIEPGPEDTKAAIERVREALLSQQDQGSERSVQGLMRTLGGPVGRFVAAAVLLIAAGFLAGRVSSHVDIEQLELTLESRLTSSVEAAIRKDLLDEVNRSWQSALASHHAKLSDEFSRFTVELGERRQTELNEFAAKILAASNAVTHQLLDDLVQAIASAQDQDRQLVTAVMRHIESNRIKDTARLNVGLVALAEQTYGELAQTKRSVAQLAGAISPDRTSRGIQENQ
ncbi:MAG: hypothetical protein ACYS8Z_11515 [Planctomycetota bacterium]|jgi:hypothetical protein